MTDEKEKYTEEEWNKTRKEYYIDIKETRIDKLLSKGEHFGEISLLYNCNRTASVVCKSYNIMGFINLRKFQYLSQDYPMLRKYFKRHVYSYKDPFKDFMANALRKLTYFNPEINVPQS